jgi:hypothetical protein
MGLSFQERRVTADSTSGGGKKAEGLTIKQMEMSATD